MSISRKKSYRIVGKTTKSPSSPNFLFLKLGKTENVYFVVKRLKSLNSNNANFRLRGIQCGLLNYVHVDTRAMKMLAELGMEMNLLEFGNFV